MSAFSARLTNILGYTHLIYLGLLPALATFSLLFRYGHAAPLLLLLGGTVAVSVYLAFLITYTRFPGSMGWAILVLLDAPVWVVLSLHSSKVTPFAFAIEGFLVDGAAIWISILVLVLISDIPTKQQRWASVGFMVAALATTAWLIWPYYRAVLATHWFNQGILGLGIIEATFVYFKILKQDEVVRDDKSSVWYIVPFILLWVGSLILGNVLHELSHK